jgi:hypothetical protein
MDNEQLYLIFNKIRDEIGAETLLEDLFQALSSKEIEENLQDCDSVRHLNLFND